MTIQKYVKRLIGRRTQLIGLSIVATVCLLSTVVLTLQVFLKLNEYRSSIKDNVQWTVAKLEVEHAKLISAIIRLQNQTDENLSKMRERFDIFYSRVYVLEHGDAYRQTLSKPDERALIESISEGTLELAGLIDNDDASVFSLQHQILARAEDLTANLMRLSSVGIAYDVTRRELQRMTLTQKLNQLIVLSLFLLATLAALLALFWQLSYRYRNRALQNRTTLNRINAILKTSQDAIVVVGENGAIIESNDVARRVFALSDDSHKLISDILFEEGEQGTTVVTGEKLTASCEDGPNLGAKLAARDKAGRVFPVELSANMASRAGDSVCVCFIRDISQRIAAEAEMYAARDKAFAGERAKARFLGMISHEMRTPLNGILGALDLLDDTGLSQEQMKYAQIMQSSGQLLLNQIDDALDITQADGNRLSLVSDQFDLDMLLDELVQSQQTQAVAQNNQLHLLRTPTPLGHATGDQNRLRQILLNLLTNAIKFTRDGQITIEVARLGDPDTPSDEVEFQISDTGIGIAEDDINRIFDDFIRVEENTSDAADGTGLGLGIARHLATMMGGTIGAESVRHEGSVFWVRIPLPYTSAQPASALRQPKDPVPARPLKVLVVDDNATSRFVLHEMLRKDGHEVEVTSSGTDAVRAAQANSFDLILMDINMPGVDGIEATRQIRSGNGASSDARIVALTAHFRPEHNDRLRASRIDGICTKPLRRAALRDILAGATVCDRPESAQTGVDTQVLDQLCAVLPQQNLTAVLDEFVTEGHSFIERLDSFDTTSAQDIIDHLHHFAGSAATFGAVALQTALCRAETAAIEHDSDSLDAELKNLPALWQATLTEIEIRRKAA